MHLILCTRPMCLARNPCLLDLGGMARRNSSWQQKTLTTNACLALDHLGRCYLAIFLEKAACDHILDIGTAVLLTGCCIYMCRDTPSSEFGESDSLFLQGFMALRYKGTMKDGTEVAIKALIPSCCFCGSFWSRLFFSFPPFFFGGGRRFFGPKDCPMKRS